MSDELKLNKHDYFVLDAIDSFQEGKGIGWPALDRRFYTRIARDENTTDNRIYKIQLGPIIQKLKQHELIADSESKNGVILSEKGKLFLEELKKHLEEK